MTNQLGRTFSSCEHLPLPADGEDERDQLAVPEKNGIRRSVSWGNLTVRTYELTPDDVASKRSKSVPIAMTYEPCETATQLQVPPSR